MLIFLLHSLYFSAQKTEIVYFLGKDLRIIQNKKTKKYEVGQFLTSTKFSSTIKNIRFVKQVSRDFYQIIDGKNKIRYLNNKGEIIENPEIMNWVCGTVCRQKNLDFSLDSVFNI